MSATVTLEFTPVFSAKMQQLLMMLDKDLVDVPLIIAGWEWANAAKEIAPYLTGTFRRSIAVFPSEEKGTILVGSDVPYGARLEFGYEGPDRLGRRFHQQPRPTFRRSLDQSKEQMQTAMVESMWALLARAA